MLTIKSTTRKTKTVSGVSAVAFAGKDIGTVVTPAGSTGVFNAVSADDKAITTANSLSAAKHAVWRNSEGKARSTRGGDHRSGATFVTRKEAAAKLGISSSTLARRISDGTVVATDKGVRV